MLRYTYIACLVTVGFHVPCVDTHYTYVSLLFASNIYYDMTDVFRALRGPPSHETVRLKSDSSCKIK